VKWHTFKLPGVAGVLGGLHSLLEVQVGVDDAMSAYAIEKAEPPAQQAEWAENGVYISHFTEVAVQLSSAPLHELSVPERRGLSLMDLRKVAVDLGPYCVGSRNCHHAAMEMYNLCAAREHQVKELPNALLVGLANAFCCVGFDPSKLARSSQFVSVQVTSCSFASQVDKSSCGIAMQPASSLDDGRVFAAARLAAWIYDPQADTTQIVNESMEDLVLYSEESDKSIEVPPGRAGALEFGDAEESYVRINRKGLFGLTSRRTRLGRQQLRRGFKYSAQISVHDVAECSILEEVGVPRGMESKHLECGLVQWAIVSDAACVYVVFKGTSEALDAMIDLSALPDYHRSHGLGVHTGMWTALRQRPADADIIREKVQKELQASHKKLVLCGHSLGGGYALLTGLDFLENGKEVDAVITFGAPQVVVPDDTSKLWRQLRKVTKQFVNSYDIVPRMPGCTDWLKTLPEMSYNVNTAIKVRAPGWLRKLAEKNLDEANLSALTNFSTVGEVIFISEGVHHVRLAGFDAAVLAEMPPDGIGFFVLEQHSMANYLQILRGCVARSTVV